MLYIGQVIYHSNGPTRGVIREINGDKISIEWDVPVNGKESSNMSQESIGEHLFFSANDSKLTIEELSAKREYQDYVKEKLEYEMFKKRLEKERQEKALIKQNYEAEKQDVAEIMDQLILKVVKIISESPCMYEINKIFADHNSGHINYEDIDEQYLYLTRFFYAYYYEYSSLLATICSTETTKKFISIGCGSCLDALALKHIADRNFCSYEYLGIDPVDWESRNLFFDKLTPEAKFYQSKISPQSTDLLQNADVILFPKSITDISIDSFWDLQACIENTEFKNDRIILAISYICGINNSETSKNSQDEKYYSIVQSFSRKGYVVKKSIDNPIKIEFDEPTKLLDFFRGKMELLCPKYKQENKHCNDAFSCKDNHTTKMGEKWFIQPRLSNTPLYKITCLERLGAQNDIKCK